MKPIGSSPRDPLLLFAKRKKSAAKSTPKHARKTAGNGWSSFEASWNSPKRENVLKCLLLALAVLVTYLPALELTWIWDDDQYVTGNVLLRTWRGLAAIWFEPSQTPQYYPVVFSLLWAEFKLFGLNAFGFHLINVILHAVNAILCYQVLKRLELGAAFWIALAFGVHPIQVESVAWVTEVKNLLSGTFYGLAWLTIWPLLVWHRIRPTSGENVANEGVAHSARHGENGSRHLGNSRFDLATQGLTFSWWRYLAGSGLFLLALLSKSVTASLPAAMLVAVWYRNGRLTLRNWQLAVPLLLIGGIAGSHTANLEREHVGASGSDWEYGFLDRIGIAAKCVVHYIGQVVWPAEQMFFYPRFEPSVWQLSSLLAILACFVMVVGSLWLAFRGQRGPMAGLAFFIGSALPALGFLNVYPHRFSFVADHFVYLPVIGLLGVLWSAMAMLVARMASFSGQYKQSIGVLPLLLVIGLYVMAVNEYLPAFSTSVSLWEDTLRKNPSCPAAMQNLGLEYLRYEQFAESEAILRRADAFEFDRYQTQNSLGLVLTKLGRFDDAKKAFVVSTELNPDNPRPWINLANLTRVVGEEEGSTERTEEIAGYYRRAWEIRPEYLSAFGLGVTYFEAGQYTSAADWFERAALESPSDFDANYNWARCLLEVQDFEQAQKMTERLAVDYPDNSSITDLLSEIASLRKSVSSERGQPNR